jgi:hypothetical protein
MVALAQYCKMPVCGVNFSLFCCRIHEFALIECIFNEMAVNNPTPVAEGLEVVVIGSFNPGIFHPAWFLHQNLIDQEEADSQETKVNVVGREVTEIQICGIKLQSLSDRLAVSTANISQAARIEDLMIQIFTLLSHIPVTACGINAHAFYSVSSRQFWHKIGHTLVPKELIWNELVDSPGMQSVTIKAPRKGEFQGEIYLTVEPSMDPRFDPGLFVRSNYHYPLPKETLHSGSTELLMKFIKTEFGKASEMAKVTANKIFEKIRPDDD